MSEPSSQRPPAPWAVQPSEDVERITPRVRRLVEGLPDWDPLPPGEILVQRPRHEL